MDSAAYVGRCGLPGSYEGSRAGEGVYLLTASPIQACNVCHLVGTYGGNSVRLYANGILEGISYVSGKTLKHDGEPLTIGGPWSTYAGQIAEVRVYAEALNARQVVELYQSYPQPAD